MAQRRSNVEQYWSVGPGEPMDVDLPWREETLQDTDPALADPRLRMLMGRRLVGLLDRLRRAPSRPRPRTERVRLDEIDPVEYPGASEGWYLDRRTGRQLIFEDQVNVGWWREKAYPRDAFTVGELVALEAELWAAAERMADERKTLSPKQRTLSVGIVEAADGLRMRIALMKLQPKSPEEAAKLKRSMLEIIARHDEENPPSGDWSAEDHAMANRLSTEWECVFEDLGLHREDEFDAEERGAPEFTRRTGLPFLAAGGTRVVFALDADRVIKLPYGPREDTGEASNLTECEVWKQATQDPEAMSWLAPVVACADDGEWLVMARARAYVTDEEYRDRIGEPGSKWLRTLGIDDYAHHFQWGIVDELPVLLDYGSVRYGFLPTHNPVKPDPKLVVVDQASARRAMGHPAVKKQHERSLRKRRGHSVAVLVPCAARKPYRESRSHSLGYLPALEGKPVDVWVVSEPMGVIPYEWSDSYPNTAYEFDPKHVKGKVRVRLVEMIRHWLEAHGTKYQRVYLALPAHHMALVCDAAEDVDGLDLYDASISACRELGYCPATHFRATSGRYVEYLRGAIK